MASNSTWPVVQPLPRFIVQLGLGVCFVLGHVLLWNDRRVVNAQATKLRTAEAHTAEFDRDVHKPIGFPAYK